MVPLCLFLWTAVIKPLIAWFRGEQPAKEVKGEGDDKAPDESKLSAGSAPGESEEQSAR